MNTALSTGTWRPLARFADVLRATGYAEFVGGDDALDAGIRDLHAGAIVLAAELAMAEAAGVALPDAVARPNEFPHAARAHGLLADILELAVPAELRPWVDRVMAMAPPPDAPEVRRALVECALAGDGDAWRFVAKFALFELLCLEQRLLLLAAHRERTFETRRARGCVSSASKLLSTVGGGPCEVEQIAGAELERILALPEYAGAVLGAGDAVEALVEVVRLRLFQRTRELEAELARVAEHIAERLDRRREILARMDDLEPAEAVLLYNEAASQFDDERLPARLLARRHPILVGDVGENVIHKRTSRLRANIGRRRHDERTPKRRRASTFGELLLDATETGGST